MFIRNLIGCVVCGIVLSVAIIVSIMKKITEKTTYKAVIMNPINPRKMGVYEKYVKRVLDIVCALGAIVIFSPLYLGIAILVKVKLGSPVLFAQDRPGLVGTDGKEKVFKMYKFRSMTDERDENDDLLSDELRMTKFGKWLRNTSLDELPEAFNILNGTMSIIGPRPQLIRDMVFMSDEQRKRHTAKPGLSGLAQVNGRNSISWEDKINWDLEYINNVSFREDVRIIIATIKKALIKQEGITQEDMVTAEDYGDYLLRTEKIDKNDYDLQQKKAKSIISTEDNIERENGLVSIIMPSYNTARYLKDTIQSVLAQTYKKWELLIVDDCSTDNTDEIFATIKDNRIRYFKNEKNSGAAVSRNKALQEARGQWIAYLDSDDLWMPEKLERQIDFMEKNGYIFSYTNYEEIDVNGNKTGVIVTGPRKITKAGMFNYCWPGCLTVMYDATKIGLIQIQDIKKNNDYAMWLKVCRKADCYLLDEVLGQYRKGRIGSISTHSIKTMIGWHYKLYHEAEGMGNFESMFNTGRNLVFGFYKKKRYVKR